jgi:hypothetical protein
MRQNSLELIDTLRNISTFTREYATCSTRESSRLHIDFDGRVSHFIRRTLLVNNFNFFLTVLNSLLKSMNRVNIILFPLVNLRNTPCCKLFRAVYSLVATKATRVISHYAISRRRLESRAVIGHVIKCVINGSFAPEKLSTRVDDPVCPEYRFVVNEIYKNMCLKISFYTMSLC